MSVFSKAVEVMEDKGWIQTSLYRVPATGYAVNAGGVCVLGAFYWAKHPEMDDDEMLDLEIETIINENGPELAMLEEIAAERMKVLVTADAQHDGEDPEEVWDYYLTNECSELGALIWRYNDDHASYNDIVSLLNECDARMALAPA